MTLDELKRLLKSGAVIQCKSLDQKRDVIQAMIDMGFSCSSHMRESVNMGFPFVGLTGTHVDGFQANYVKDCEPEIIPAEEVLGTVETTFVVMNVTSLLV